MDWKVGDECILSDLRANTWGDTGPHMPPNPVLVSGGLYIITQLNAEINNRHYGPSVRIKPTFPIASCSYIDWGISVNCISRPNERKSMFNSLSTDVRKFVQEHKGVIYTVAFCVLVDHFVFGGAFRERLKTLLDTLICKVEKKVKDS